MDFSDLHPIVFGNVHNMYRIGQYRATRKNRKAWVFGNNVQAICRILF